MYRRGIGARTPRIDPGARDRLAARFGAAVHAWFDDLPGVLDALAGRWRLELGAPIPSGSVSVVLHARGADGQPSVLKLSPDMDRIGLEAAALDVWRPPWVPAVLAFDASLGALLLEAIEPGDPLALARSDPGARRIAALLRGLHAAAAPARFPGLARRVDALFDSSAALYDRHPGASGIVPRPLYEQGRVLAARMAREAGPVVLLHGDLTPANVLHGGPERGLVAIDPAPCCGDPAFDAVDLLLWRIGDPAQVTARAGRLAAATGGDAGRMVAWCGAFAAMVALELAAQGRGGGRRLAALLELASRA